MVQDGESTICAAKGIRPKIIFNTYTVKRKIRWDKVVMKTQDIKTHPCEAKSHTAPKEGVRASKRPFFPGSTPNTSKKEKKDTTDL